MCLYESDRPFTCVAPEKHNKRGYGCFANECVKCVDEQLTAYEDEIKRKAIEEYERDKENANNI